MYGKLLQILNRENANLKKQRLGPVTLNLSARRQEITKINSENEFMSRKLSQAKSYVPSQQQLEKEHKQNQKFRRAVSTRRADGKPHEDPLVKKRKRFVRLTSNLDGLEGLPTALQQTYNASQTPREVYGIQAD